MHCLYLPHSALDRSTFSWNNATNKNEIVFKSRIKWNRERLRRSISQDDPLINWTTPASSTERHARRSWSVGQGRLTFFITGVLSVASESDTAYEKGSGQPPVRETIRYSNCIEAVFYYLFMRETNSSCNVQLIDAVYYFASQDSKMFDCFEL